MESFSTQRKVFVFLFARENCFKIKSLKGSSAANLIINRLECHSDVIQLSLVSLKELRTEKRIRKAFILHVIKKAFSSLIFQNLYFPSCTQIQQGIDEGGSAGIPCDKNDPRG